MVSIAVGGTARSRSKMFRGVNLSVFLLLQVVFYFKVAIGFGPNYSFSVKPVSRLFASEKQDDEVTQQVERAKALLAKTKAKIEAKEKAKEEAEEKQSNVPFFASKAKAGDKKDKVIKSRNAEGLFTTDGALMAEISETEEWEARSLLDVFESESLDPNDHLADRDVAASIFGLQRVLQMEDFQKIFDKRNRFIGEQ